MVKDYPVSGIGMDQFLYQHAPRYISPEAWSERYISHPHNILFDAWLSLGLPGLLLLLAAVTAMVLRAFTIRAGLAADRAAAAASVAALATGLTHGLVDNAYFLPDLAVLTWILIAVSMSGSPHAEMKDLNTQSIHSPASAFQ